MLRQPALVISPKARIEGRIEECSLPPSQTLDSASEEELHAVFGIGGLFR